MRDASQAASAFTPQERTSVQQSIVRSVQSVRNHKYPPTIPQQLVALINYEGQIRSSSFTLQPLRPACHPSQQSSCALPGKVWPTRLLPSAIQ